VHAPQGMQGGDLGSRGTVALNGALVKPKVTHDLSGGAVITMELPGGGGFGAASRRDADAYQADRRAGLVN
jgi:N-methylhydantoinase B